MSSLDYIDRETGQTLTESVYGEAFLRFTYNNPLGRFGLFALFKRALFSKLYGAWADSRLSRSEVPRFVQKFNINMDDYAKDTADFANFNAFFTRELAANARPIHGDDSAAVLPADGRHRAFASLLQTHSFNLKNIAFNTQRLFQDPDLAKLFDRGSALMSRLCPVDYHRFHFPVSGKIIFSELISGPLLSVNPIALAKHPSILWENKRQLTIVDSPAFGKVAIIPIGATCVGSIITHHKAGEYVEKGQEMGLFKFGGSSIVTLFQNNRAKMAQDLIDNTGNQLETYDKMGAVFASAAK